MSVVEVEWRDDGEPTEAEVLRGVDDARGIGFWTLCHAPTRWNAGAHAICLDLERRGVLVRVEQSSVAVRWERR